MWKCEWREHIVAVKKLLNHWINTDSNCKFQQEIRFLQTIRHPNIVLFYGAGELEVIICYQILTMKSAIFVSTNSYFNECSSTKHRSW